MKKMRVHVSIADLRREPMAPKHCYEKDPLQESQLLYGEQLIGKEEKDGWVFVEAVEQLKYASGQWVGYPGWIHRSHVSDVHDFFTPNLVVQVPWSTIQTDHKPLAVCMGTCLEGEAQTDQGWTVRLVNGALGWIPHEHVRAIPQQYQPLSDNARRDIIAQGKHFLGHPYLWGGRSVYHPDYLSSCDCSGLVNMLYRLQGIQVPRDAHDQFLVCEKREFCDLLPGDLIFWSMADKPQRIVHVMLYAGGDELLDSNLTFDGCVVHTTAKERFGRTFASIRWGETVGQFNLFFGCFPSAQGK